MPYEINIDPQPPPRRGGPLTRARRAENERRAAQGQGAGNPLQPAADPIQIAHPIMANVPPPPQGGPLPGPPPPVPPAAAFQMSPAENDDILTFPQDNKIYFKTTKGLDTKFGGKADQVHTFLTLVERRARSFGWKESILMIPDNNGTVRYLLKEYGRLTMDNVRTHAAPYVAAQTRQAQNDRMMYDFLEESLEEKFLAEVTLYEQEYLITPAAGGEPILNGPAFLKQIITQTYIDTRATVSHIRETLIDMHKMLKIKKEDITQFNLWVKNQVSLLAARGTEAHDLLTYLWKTYLQVKDKEFVRYIQDLKNQYEDNTTDLTSDQLMLYAENKYKSRVQAGIWAKPSKEQEDIVALTATVANLKEALNKSKINRKFGKANTHKKNPEGGQEKNKNTKKSDPKYENSEQRIPWYYQAPKSNEPKHKNINEKDYWWCSNHGENGKWVRHKPEDCSNKDHSNWKNNNTTKKTAKINSSTPTDNPPGGGLTHNVHQAVVNMFGDE